MEKSVYSYVKYVILGINMAVNLICPSLWWKSPVSNFQKISRGLFSGI